MLRCWFPALKFAAENSLTFFVLGFEMQDLTRLLGFGVGAGSIRLMGGMFRTSTQSSESRSTTGGRTGGLKNGRKNGVTGGLWALALIRDAEKVGINGGLGFGGLGRTGKTKDLTGRVGRNSGGEKNGARGLGNTSGAGCTFPGRMGRRHEWPVRPV